MKHGWTPPEGTQRDQADAIVQEAWEEVCDGRLYSDVQAMIEAYHLIGIFDNDRAELWELRVRSCPGHFDGGRVWCSYCGDIPREMSPDHNPLDPYGEDDG